MTDRKLKEAGDYLYDSLRLKTFPLAIRFAANLDELPEKTRRPSQALGKRVTICQGVTMARVYGWTVGLSSEDLICVPAMIAFGFSGAQDPPATLAKLFCDVTFSKEAEGAEKEVSAMSTLENNEVQALVLSPLQKGLYEPQTVVVYGNPAQIMRLIQAWVFMNGEKLRSQFGGKVECTEYLIAPTQDDAPRVVIPGMGDRIFSMTQDDEMVFALPGHRLDELVEGLQQAGRKIGGRYPVTFYQNFQPEFPPVYKNLGKELGLDRD